MIDKIILFYLIEISFKKYWCESLCWFETNAKNLSIYPYTSIYLYLTRIHSKSQSRKYSKYNELIYSFSSWDWSVLRYVFPSPVLYPDSSAALGFIFGGGGCALSLFVFSFSSTYISGFFFFILHSKLETLKISGRKESLFGDTRWLKNALERGRERQRKKEEEHTEKSTRKKTSKKRNPRGHIRITFKPRFTPLRRFFLSAACLVRIVFILPCRSNGTGLEIEWFHRDKSFEWTFSWDNLDASG